MKTFVQRFHAQICAPTKLTLLNVMFRKPQNEFAFFILYITK